MFLLNKVDSKV